MSTLGAGEIYKRYISPLPASEQLRLLVMLAQGLASETIAGEKPSRSIMELHELGKDIWVEIDAQTYVNKLRDEWDIAHP
ncbi:MAG TPA: hypothetical protein VLQ48_02470 [Chloroflexia bacterium]|nr:hypothetical protein [Chloroflexia bacterium]